MFLELHTTPNVCIIQTMKYMTSEVSDFVITKGAVEIINKCATDLNLGTVLCIAWFSRTFCG